MFRGEHVNILNAGRRYKGILTADLGDVDEQALQMASILPPTTPVLIETIPGNLDKITAAGPRASTRSSGSSTSRRCPGPTTMDTAVPRPRGRSCEFPAGAA